MPKTIICSGDGSLDRNNPYMDFYVLGQTNKTNPKICLLPTASHDNDKLIEYFKRLFEMYPCEPSAWSVLYPETNDSKDARDFLLSQDIIFVSGGHTARMLNIWRNHGIDTILREAYENGTILAGGSAGAVCWFKSCITDSVPTHLTVMNCLGFLEHTCCPHFSSTERRKAYNYYIGTNEIAPGYGLDDGAGIHFVDGKFYRAISNYPHAKIYKLETQEENVIRKRLKTKWLGLREFREELILNTPPFVALRKS